MANLSIASLLLAGIVVQAPEGSMMFTLKNRETLTGHVRGVEGEWAVFEVTMMGGGATIRRRLADFAPESEFAILVTATPPVTFDDHFAMAKNAVRLGVMPQAGEQAGAARKLSDADPTGAQRKALDGWAGETLDWLFHEAIRQQDVIAARHYLRLIATRIPDRFSEDDMGKMFDQLADAHLQLRTTERTTVAAKESAAKHLELDKLWAPILVVLQRADEQVKDGLRNSRSTTKATQSFGQAMGHYKAAWHRLQAILEKDANNPVTQEEAGELIQRVKESSVQTALHAGNALTIQGDYRGAVEWANQALLIEPGNSDATALIRTIQVAQAAGGAWGRGWGR